MDRKEIVSMKRRIVVIILMCLPWIANAKHVVEVGVHGGLSGWSAQTVYVQPQIGFQGGAQLLYAYHSPYVLGFRTGLTFDSHNAAFGRLNYEDGYTTIDVENRPMQVDYSIGNLRETHSFLSVGVPLQLALSYRLYSLFAGVKAAFPLSGSWYETAENAALSVYYPDQNNRVYESYPLAASRNFQLTNSGKFTMPTVQWWLSLEFNYAIRLNAANARIRSYIIVGAYADYCLTKTKSESGAESLIMLTDTRDGFPLQRIFTPVHAANRQGQKLVGDRTLFDVGIKLSYALSPYDTPRVSLRNCRCDRE